MDEGDARSADRPPSPARTQPDETKLKKAYQTFSIASLGLEMGVAILIGFAIGYYLDKHFGTQPYLMLLFLGFGIAAAFKAMLRAARQAKSSFGESDPPTTPQTPGTRDRSQ